MAIELTMAGAPVVRRVRAFFAPVDRVSGTATLWDAAGIASFNVDAPPAPWVDLGWCSGFTRKSGTKVEALATGSPATAWSQVKTLTEAEVAVEFETWGKLQLALSAGVQQMNVLRTGGAAQAVLGGSTATVLQVSTASGFAVGDVVAVDVDYGGALGFVGSGVAGGYVKAAVSDADYVRRVTLNVGRVVGVAAGALTLGGPLPAGVPAAGMKVQAVAGFCDREGGSFFQEWSALFVEDGELGERVVFHYPRLQAMGGVAESRVGLVGVQAKTVLERVRLAGRFRALAVRDALDGEAVVCYRSFLPGALRTV